MSVYRLLLFAFPRRVRREFGDEMTRLFESQRREARAAGESLTRLWLRALADAATHGTAERLASLTRRRLDTSSDRLSLDPGVSLDPTGGWKMHALTHDLKHAVRLLVRQPGVTSIALLTLALGIGANSAIFSAVDTILLRPLPYEDPDQLVMVWEKRQAEGVLDNVVAPADFVDWARLNTVFQSMAAFAPSSVNLTGVGEPVRLEAGVVSPAFFDVLKVRPFLGRTFSAEEGTVGHHRVVVISHGLWQRYFGSESTIIGRKLSFNEVAHEVVGVLPASFEFPNPAIEVWAPLAFEERANRSVVISTISSSTLE